MAGLQAVGTVWHWPAPLSTDQCHPRCPNSRDQACACVCTHLRRQGPWNGLCDWPPACGFGLRASAPPQSCVPFLGPPTHPPEGRGSPSEAAPGTQRWAAPLLGTRQRHLPPGDLPADRCTQQPPARTGITPTPGSGSFPSTGEPFSEQPRTLLCPQVRKSATPRLSASGTEQAGLPASPASFSWKTATGSATSSVSRVHLFIHFFSFPKKGNHGKMQFNL